MMIRAQDGVLPGAALIGRETLVARNPGAVADGRDRARAAGATVAVDHEPRIGLEYVDGVERAGERGRHAVDADVPADVAGALCLLEAEIAEPARHGAAGVIREEDERRRPMRHLDSDGLRVARLEEIGHPASSAREAAPAWREGPGSGIRPVA
jgi:hypothetical protein